MPDGGERMMEDHSGARITHDGPDFLPHVGTVTMHRTLFTRRFFVTESTVFQADHLFFFSNAIHLAGFQE